MNYQPHQQRVVDEQAELDVRREKLLCFFDAELFAKLPGDEQGLMKRQAKAMADYSAILTLRINAFKG